MSNRRRAADLKWSHTQTLTSCTWVCAVTCGRLALLRCIMQYTIAVVTSERDGRLPTEITSCKCIAERCSLHGRRCSEELYKVRFAPIQRGIRSYHTLILRSRSYMNYVTHFRAVISWAIEAMAELIDLNYIIRIGSLTNIFLDIYVMYMKSRINHSFCFYSSNHSQVY